MEKNREQKTLELKGIRKAFPGVLALDAITFDIRRGEVQGLVGENGAGKSTLVKIMCGVYQADQGDILIEGKVRPIHNPSDAQAAGIQVMHQEISVIPDMTVAENIWLYNLPNKGNVWMDYKKMNRKTEEILNKLGLDHLAPTQKMSGLSLADQQMTNLARIVSTNPKVILLDEPTAALTMNEAEKLFQVIERFKEMGVAIIYISHYIDEVLRICDRITILRDGKHIATVDADNVTNEKVVSHMVGHSLKKSRREAEKAGAEILKLTEVSTAKIIQYINLNLRNKEVLGLYGLNGAGKTETLRAISGADPLLTGKIELFGEDISKERSSEIMKKGLVYVPEDRRRLGLVMPMSVRQNASLGNESKYSSAGFMKTREEKMDVGEYIKKMRVRTPGMQTLISTLSGGNQQKVILARCLARQAKVFLMDEPTVGIDVGARAEIYDLISEIVKVDAAVIIASSDINEILEVCDRVAIIANGKIAAVMEHDEMKEEKMLLYAMGD